jgi:hypothetical protein
VEGSPGKLLDGDRVPFQEIEGWSTINERPGFNAWWGRFWLPGGNRVEPIRKYCLIRGDGRPGEMIIDRFGPSQTEPLPKGQYGESIAYSRDHGN